MDACVVAPLKKYSNDLIDSYQLTKINKMFSVVTYHLSSHFCSLPCTSSLQIHLGRDINELSYQWKINGPQTPHR
jgi:hypothetical protein